MSTQECQSKHRHNLAGASTVRVRSELIAGSPGLARCKRVSRVAVVQAPETVSQTHETKQGAQNTATFQKPAKPI